MCTLNTGWWWNNGSIVMVTSSHETHATSFLLSWWGACKSWLLFFHIVAVAIGAGDGVREHLSPKYIPPPQKKNWEKFWAMCVKFAILLIFQLTVMLIFCTYVFHQKCLVRQSWLASYACGSSSSSIAVIIVVVYELWRVICNYYLITYSVVTVSHLARSVNFGSVLRKKPRFGTVRFSFYYAATVCSYGTGCGGDKISQTMGGVRAHSVGGLWL